MATSAALPGLHTPGVGFDQPFEMLIACHERVQRMLTLLQRLCDYLQERPSDDTARQAARDVLRYFDLAAPLHHEDEERHIFPLLLAQGSVQEADLVRQLQSDHEAMSADWQQVRVVLQALRDGERHALEPQDQALFARFTSRYASHIRHEEAHIYPAAQQLLEPPTVQAMGQEMARRRGAK